VSKFTGPTTQMFIQIARIFQLSGKIYLSQFLYTDNINFTTYIFHEYEKWLRDCSSSEF